MYFKNKLLRFLLKSFSLTAVLFVFQACYGTPQDFEQDLQIEGTVTDILTGNPIQGIKVQVGGTMQYTLTDESGRFYMYRYNNHSNFQLQCTDVDSLENGNYSSYDTTVVYTAPYMNVDIALESR